MDANSTGCNNAVEEISCRVRFCRGRVCELKWLSDQECVRLVLSPDSVIQATLISGEWEGHNENYKLSVTLANNARIVFSNHLPSLSCFSFLCIAISYRFALGKLHCFQRMCNELGMSKSFLPQLQLSSTNLFLELVDKQEDRALVNGRVALSVHKEVGGQGTISAAHLITSFAVFLLASYSDFTLYTNDSQYMGD